MAASKTTIDRDVLSKAIEPQRDRAYEIHALASILTSAITEDADADDVAMALRVICRSADDIAAALELDVLLGNLPRTDVQLVSLLADAIDLVNRDEKGDALEKLAQIQTLLEVGGDA